MKSSLPFFRFCAFLILFLLKNSFSFSAIIVSVATGNWSASAWPNTVRMGTISTSTLSTTVTGVGTTFNTQISVGNIIETAGNVVIGTVLTVNSATSLTLTANALSNNAGIAFNFQGIGPGDAALIAGGNTVTVDNAFASCISLGTNNSGVGGSDLIFSAGSQLTVTGIVTVGVGGHSGSIDMTNGGILICQRFNVTNPGIWTPGLGTVELTTSNTLPATFFTSFNNLIIVSGITTTGVALTINGDLSIGSGTANFTAAGFALTVNGTTTIGSGTLGVLTISSAVGTKTFVGLVTVNTGGTWNNISSAAVNFQGGILNSGTFNAGNGIQTFSTNNQTLVGSFTIPNVTVTAITLTNNSTLTITASLNGSGTLAQANFAILNLDFLGAAGITALIATAVDNTVNYEFAGLQTTFPTNYYILSLSNAGVKTLQVATDTVYGDFDMTGTTTATGVVGMTIGGDVNIGTGATFNSGVLNYTVDGDVTNSGTFNGSPLSVIDIAGDVNNSGAFNANQDTIVFNGNSLETITVAITSTGSFDNLIINNSDAGLQLESDISASTTLNMTQGNIDLNGNILLLGTSPFNTGTLLRTSGTIINSVNGTGSFTRLFGTSTIADGAIAGLFPMGTVSNYRPFSVSAPLTAPSSGGSISVDYIDANGNTAVSIPDPPDTIVVQDNFSWSVIAGNGLAGGVYDLDAAGTGFGLVGNVADLRLSLLDSVVGTPGVNGGTTINPQVNRTNLSFADLSNPFFVGSVDSTTSPLPISLLYFTATPVNGEVRLDWETAAEFNNDHYTILRSVNTSGWESVALVPGSGNTSVDTKYRVYDQKPLGGVSYYRLEQTDRDGRQSYSAIVSVNMGVSTTINLYPNPASSYIFITTVGTGTPDISLINGSGQQMIIPILINGNNVRLTISDIPPGTYFVNIIQNGVSETRSVIKK
jgi:hypothetical protein